MVTLAKKPPKNAQPCESAGQTWWLSEVTPAFRRVFASMIRARSRQQLIDDKTNMSEKEYTAEWDRLQDRIDAGAYDWGPPVELGGTGAGKAIRAAMDSDEGTLLLIQLLLAETHGEVELPKVTEIINANPEGITAAIRAAQGLPPLASTPAAEEGPGTTKTTEAPMPVTPIASAA